MKLILINFNFIDQELILRELWGVFPREGGGNSFEFQYECM